MKLRCDLCAGVLLLGFGGFWPSGCGGGGPECAEGTRAQDGVCVPEIEGCGTGTVRQGDLCVLACGDGQYWDGQTCAAVPTCAPGTVFDTGLGECRPACGTDQYWDGQACAAQPTCAQGTSFDPATGACRPDDSACAAGTVLQDGQCVPVLDCGPGTHQEGPACVLDQLPDPDVVESPVDGESAVFELPPAGGEITLGGRVDDPIDKDGDGFVDADWDAFEFEAPAGTWLRISASSEGATLPAFLLDLQEVDADGNRIWRRAALTPDSPTCAREVYLHRAGRYLLWLTDFNEATAYLFGYSTIPVGGEAFTYFVQVQNLGTPAPQQVTVPHEARHDLSDGALEFVTLAGLSVGDAVEVTARPVRPDDLAEAEVFPALLVLDNTGAALSEYVSWNTWESAAALLEARAGQSLTVVRDFLVTIGTQPQVDFLARRLTPTGCPAPACDPAVVTQDGSLLLRWNLTSGDFFVAGIYFDPMGETMIHQQLVDADFAPLADPSLVYPGQHGAVWTYAESAGPIYLWLRWGDGAAAGEFPIDARIHATGALNPDSLNSGLPVLEMPPGTLLPLGIEHFSGLGGKVVFLTELATHGAGWMMPFEAVRNGRLDQLGPVLDVDSWMFPDGYCTPLFTYIRDDGHYLYTVFDQQGDPTGGTYDVRLSVLDAPALGPIVPGTPVRREYQSPNGPRFYTFEAGAGQTVSITVDPVLLSDLQAEIWVMNFGRVVWDWIYYVWLPEPEAAQLGLVLSETAAAPADNFTIQYVSPYDGLSVLLVEDAGGLAGPADLFHLELSVQ